MWLWYVAIPVIPLTIVYSLRLSAQPRSIVQARNSLYPGEALENGQKLTSHSGQFAMVMQSDGNLVLYSGGNPIWSSRTYGKGLSPYRLVMQEDSNLRIYDVSGRCTWTSGTPRAGKPGALATMQGRIKSCEDYMKIRIMSLMGTLHMTSSVLILATLLQSLAILTRFTSAEVLGALDLPDLVS